MTPDATHIVWGALLLVIGATAPATGTEEKERRGQ